MPLDDRFWEDDFTSLGPADLVKLKDGAVVPKASVLMLMGILNLMVENMNPEKTGSEAMSWALASYDLHAISNGDPAYPAGCFGLNRQKLISLNLVTEDDQGGLIIHSDIKDIVRNSLEFDRRTFVAKVNNPLLDQGWQ